MRTLVNPIFLVFVGIALILQGCNLDKVNPNDPVVADFTIGNNNCTASCMVSFDASTSQNAISYEWDFGDGNVGSGENSNHTYDFGGEYPVTLKVSGSDGSMDSMTQTVFIEEDSTLRACFSIDSFSCLGFAPVEIFISNCSQFGTSYSWVWNDGTASQDENPGSHVFENPGVYNIQLTIQDGAGNSDDTTITFTVLSPSTFAQDYGQGGDYDEGRGLVMTSDGNFVLAGYFTDTLATGVDATSTISKVDKNGSIIWKRDYSPTNVTAYWKLIETSDGGLAMTGIKSDNDTLIGRYDVHFVKTDSDGNIIVDRTFGDSDNTEWGWSLVEATDGNFFILSADIDPISSDSHPWVLKLDRNGNVLWQKFFGTDDTEPNFATNIIATPNGGFAFAGQKRAPGQTDFDAWILASDKDGNVTLEKTYASVADKSDYAIDLSLSSTGGFIIAGRTFGKGAGGADVWIIRTDANGNTIWDKTYGFSTSESVFDILEDKDGNILIAATTSAIGNGNTDIWLIKTDANGNQIWDEAFGGPRFDAVASIVETDDCGYAVFGRLDAASGRNDQWYLVKMNNNGKIN
ncbi:MAG: PKD domain-containing protein [Bacteroidia bacterium]|nr:PKD domain-containing protein [Bacteroidia bacterium]